MDRIYQQPTILDEPTAQVPTDFNINLVASPHMALYMKRSTEIYNIYLKYVAPTDIHVYSIDEVFMDITDYLATCRYTVRKLVMTIIRMR